RVRLHLDEIVAACGLRDAGGSQQYRRQQDCRRQPEARRTTSHLFPPVYCSDARWTNSVHRFSQGAWEETFRRTDPVGRCSTLRELASRSCPRGFPTLPTSGKSIEARDMSA